MKTFIKNNSQSLSYNHGIELGKKALEALIKASKNIESAKKVASKLGGININDGRSKFHHKLNILAKNNLGCKSHFFDKSGLHILQLSWEFNGNCQNPKIQYILYR